MESQQRGTGVADGDAAANEPAAPPSGKPQSLEHAAGEATAEQGQGRAPKRGRSTPRPSERDGGGDGIVDQPPPPSLMLNASAFQCDTGQPAAALGGVTAAVTSEVLMSDGRIKTSRHNSSGNSDDTTARQFGSSSSPTAATRMPPSQLSIDIPAVAPQQPQPAVASATATASMLNAEQQDTAMPVQMQQDGGSGLVAVKDELQPLPPPIAAATQQNPGSNGGSTSLSRRVLANRQSAARSKERRRGYVIGLEQSVKRLTQQINEQQAHLHSLASNSATLGTANFALSQHANGLEEQLRNHETEMSELRQECDRLRHAALQSPSSSRLPLEGPSTSLPVSGTSMAESQYPGQPTSGEVQSAQSQELHQEWEQYMSWGGDQQPATEPAAPAPAVSAQDTPMADASAAAVPTQQAQANGSASFARAPSIQTGGDAVWRSSSGDAIAPVHSSSIQTGGHGAGNLGVTSAPDMLQPGAGGLPQMPWCGASAADPRTCSVTSLLPPLSPGMPPLPVHWPPGYDTAAAATATAQAANAAAASQPAGMMMGPGSSSEMDRLVAQYAAAPPPGLRLGQPGRVHDPGSLRLSSAPAGMQIRIAGAGGSNSVAAASQPTHIPGPPQQLQQQPQQRHHSAAPAQQPQLQQQPVGGHSIMQQATMQQADPQKVPSVDLDQMADIFNTFDANDDMFPGLGRPQ